MPVGPVGELLTRMTMDSVEVSGLPAQEMECAQSLKNGKKRKIKIVLIEKNAKSYMLMFLFKPTQEYENIVNWVIRSFRFSAK